MTNMKVILPCEKNSNNKKKNVINISKKINKIDKISHDIFNNKQVQVINTHTQNIFLKAFEIFSKIKGF